MSWKWQLCLPHEVMNTQYMNDDICYTHTLQILHLLPRLLLLNETQPNISRYHTTQEGMTLRQRAGIWLQITRTFKFKLSPVLKLETSSWVDAKFK